jgi:alkanesulfonate monooxygenase SsuD/methylene tetrahydromethanopterin reductase-like flavin-dependent oxidoreductase (luciferase family)
MSDAVRVGITLPTFTDDPGSVVDLAQEAERVGVDGVFVFDHLFRRANDGSRRPSLDAVAVIGAIAAATTRITIGTLVFRAWLRPAASLATIVGTAARLAPDRFVAGIGAGDGESREENETFGLGFGSVDDRLACLAEAVRAARDRGAPIWVGGHITPLRELAAAEADGWNCWGGHVESFAGQVQSMRAAAAREPFTCSWAGLVLLEASDELAHASAERLGAGAATIVGGPETVAAGLRARGDAGADWIVLGPQSAREGLDLAMLGERVVPQLH